MRTKTPRLCAVDRLPLWMVVAVLLATGGAAQAATPTELASGLAAPIGIDYDLVNNHLYFVEWSAGDLRRMVMTPGCEAASPPTCSLDPPLYSSFNHPQDVAVVADLGIAYVTTRDDPGTSGSLWRVDLASGTPSLVTFNLGAPHQIALDSLNNTAYVVGFDMGRLWKIDLTTGSKVTVNSSLDRPIGLLITSDRTRAYVTEQGAANRLVEIDLTTGAKIRDVVTGLTAAFFLEWTDPAETSLYLVERDPANKVLRVDLVTETFVEVVTGLPVRPSGAAVSYLNGALFVTTNSTLQRVALAELPLGEPVFLGVGHVPSTEIDAQGYANTAAGYFFEVHDAPFGGTLNLFGNLSNFKGLGATHYRVEVSQNGGPWTILKRSWVAYRWNPSTSKYESTTVAPETADGRYAIPAEYPSMAHRWYPPYLMMRWPSSTNGEAEFRVELFPSATGAGFSPPAGNDLLLRIDNSAPTADLMQIVQTGVGVVAPCDIVSSGPNAYRFRITAYDANHHLRGWHLWALWGKNQSATIGSDTYMPTHDDAEGTHWWSGVSNQLMPAADWAASCNCAHTFRLRATKRTINGYNYILHADSHQSVTLNNTGAACAP